MTPTIKLLTIVEATSINAVAKNVLGFHRSASELNQSDTEFPVIQGCLVTFDRRRNDQNSERDFVIAAREHGLGVEVIPERRRFDLSVIPALRNIVAARASDLLVTNSVKSHFVMWRSGLWRKYPWVAFHHGYTDTDRKMRLYNRLDRWSLPHADRLVTVCGAFAQDLVVSTGVPLEKISVQHNAIRRSSPVSAEDVESLRNRLGINETERVGLSVGRLSREKAHLDLLSAFKHRHETNPEISCKLIIVGDGPERASLEAAAGSLGYQDQVIFTGEVSNVQTFYALADVFVLPSHSEGSPNVLLEAMAANVPLVATAVGGVPEMVEDNESALLVRPNDPPVLAASIARVLTDRELAQRLTTNASTLVDGRFTPNNYARSLIEIYREVIDGRQT
jgi:glycosyltransferase involved in cell wall biosynthesis